MDLSIIIVNWNSKEYLRKCLGSILAETRELEFEIIVVDSASFDGCEEMLRKEFPQVRFIQSRENLGFAKSNNLAFQSARSEFVLFLNPDTEIVGSAINELHAAFKKLADAGAVGGRLVNTDETVQTSCIQAFPTILNQVLSAEWLRRRFPKSRLWGMAPLYETSTSPQLVEAISGACVMLPRWLLEKVGVFSEDYFMYAEDIDLSLKVSQAGYKCYYVPNATVVHHGGGSSQQAGSNLTSMHMQESAWRFFRKTRGRFYGLVYRASMLVSALVRLTLLVVLFPAGMIWRHRTAWRASFQKWKAILFWSVQRPKWGNDL
jgi:hypothetical protein